MKLAPERFASRRDTIAFLVCVVLSLAARVAPTFVQERIEEGVRFVSIPVLWVQQRAELMKTALTTVSRVTSQTDSTAVDALQLLMLSEENEQLRELLQLSRGTPLPHVAAEVLHQVSPLDDFTLLLSAGIDRGVTEMSPVIAPEGLVGLVRSVGVASSVAVAWTHPDFRASAMTADGTVFGIIEPRGTAGPHTALMEVRGIPFREDVPIGSQIYTSGRGSRFGGAFPRGIPIGTVRALAEQSAGWSKTYVVQPAVQPGSVSHVIILTGTDEDVSAAFQSEVP